MTAGARGFRLLGGYLTALFVVVIPSASDAQRTQTEKRPVTVPDIIRMTRLSYPGHLVGASSKGRVAQFSSDGRRFTVVLKKGDPEHNTNNYSVFLFNVADALRSPRPELLLTMASSSNYEAIKDVKWVGNNQIIAFIGADGRETPQVYSFDLSTKRLEKMTDNPTPILAYDISPNGKEIIYKASPPIEKMLNTEKTQRQGIIVTSQSLTSLIAGDCDMDQRSADRREELFLKAQGQEAKAIPIEDLLYGNVTSFSPDGRYALAETFARNVPKVWQEYRDELVHRFVMERHSSNEASNLLRYVLIDTRTGTSSILLNAPNGYFTKGFAWAPDSQSLVISAAHLPLEGTDAAEREARTKDKYVVEVRIPRKEIVKITNKEYRVTKWDRMTGKVILESGSFKELPATAFRKNGSMWEEVALTPEDARTSSQLDLTLEEGMNNPPKIFGASPGTQQKALLLDLNPQFNELQFGKVEAITWKATDGHEVIGGLYLPPDYTTGERYPLVMQTHGFARDRFWIDGPWSSAFAAQALAGKGFVVLQVGGGSTNTEEYKKIVETPQEAQWEMSAFEGAIDHLDRKGLIDRTRVGIIGFSRTVYHVEYTLTHSKYSFAAATVADGISAGYFAYLAFPILPVQNTYDRLNGGPPFGETLGLWLKNSPGFNIDKVRTPVRIEALGPASVLTMWEWYSGLSRLSKPVDFIYLPSGTHLLVKPWERMVSQQGNVDWFTFWLKGEEDPDPAKAEQYARWRELRSLHQQNEKNSPAPSPN